MNYPDFQSAVLQLLALTDASSIAMMNTLWPRIVEATENRIYREPTFDFLYTRTSDISQSTTTGIRSVPIPSQFIVVEGVNLIIPNQTTPPASGTRVPLMRATRQFCDLIWPTESDTQTPTNLGTTYFAIFNQEDSAPADDEPISMPSAIIIAPTPDAEYRVEFTGTFQPPPLGPTNTTTFLSVYFPDLYLASSLIFCTGGILKSYGAQADDPKLAMSWMAVYEQLKSGVAVESMRQKSIIEGFSQYPPNPTKPNVAMLSQMAQQQPQPT